MNPMTFIRKGRNWFTRFRRDTEAEWITRLESQFRHLSPVH
ncbi:MAG TPA: hypothetical protein VGC78_13845 [Gaiellaceae bacterium]|jgi:hypothetical protein